MRNPGYTSQRRGHIERVYVLDTDSYAFTSVATGGDAPSWLHGHRAALAEDGSVIMVSGGLVDRPDVRSLVENLTTWELRLDTHTWKRVGQLPWRRWQFSRADDQRNLLWEIGQAVWTNRVGWEEDHRKDMESILASTGKPIDISAMAQLYRPDVEHRSLGEDGQDYRTRRIEIDAVIVRFERDFHCIQMTVEGSLPDHIVTRMLEDTRQKLEALECTDYRVEELGPLSRDRSQPAWDSSVARRTVCTLQSMLTVAAIQSLAAPGDIGASVGDHVRLATEAARQGASIAIFPELSLTGYDRGLTRADAIATDDARLAPLQNLVNAHSMTLVVGAPIESSAGLFIGAICFAPGATPAVYSKRYLHDGEEVAFIAGSGGSVLAVADRTVALAICAEITHRDHARHAAACGAHVYAASCFITPSGYWYDTGLLEGYARTYGMAVIMANYGNACGGWHSAGGSAIWSKTGKRIACAPAEGEAVVVAQVEGDNARM